MESKGEVGGGWIAWAPGMLWAGFSWALVAVISQVAQPWFFAAVRGTGIIEYPAVVVIGTVRLDRYALVGLGFGVLLLHSVFFRVRVDSDAMAFLASLGLAVGIGGFVAVSQLFVVLVGASFVLVVLEDSARISVWAGGSRRAPLARFAFWGLAGLVVVGVAGAARWVVGGLDGSTPLGDPSWGPAFVGLQLLGLVRPLLPELALLFLFMWAVRLALASELARKPWPNDGAADADPAEGGEKRVRAWWPVILFVGGMVLAVLVGVYPYLPTVNPASRLVGVDVINCYSYWLKEIPGSSVCGPVGLSIGNERAGALWFLQGLVVMTGSVDAALKLTPAVLGVLLVGSTYVLVREGTGDGVVAGVSALLAGVSTQVVAGIDAGILANWLGISVAYLFFAALLHGLRVRRLAYLAPALGLFVALLFIHPWTWAVALVVMVVYSVADLAQAAAAGRLGTKKVELTLISSLVILGLGADVGRSFLPSGSGLELAISTVQRSISLGNLAHVGPSLEESFSLYLGGAQSNTLWFVLGAVGVLAIPSLKGRFGKLMLAWVAAESFGVAFVGPPSNLLQSRFIYDIPLQVFAGFGLAAIMGFVRSGVGDEGLGKLGGALLVLGVAGLALGFALDYVGFLYL
jgi:hypothetical protein